MRIVTLLEAPYPDFDGLNLTWETLEGLAKHNGPVAAPRWAMAEANEQRDLELNSWPSLEAQLAAIADDIAYDNHDIDDGLRAGILELEELLELPLPRRLWVEVEERHPGIERELKIKALVRDGIGLMVGDVLDETRRRIEEAGVETIEDVRAAGRALAGFSADMASEERTLKRFLYDKLYDNPSLHAVRDEAQRVVTGLANAYREDAALLPEGWRRGEGEQARLRGIADFIAGMTDRFAIVRHKELVGPVELPEKF